MDAAAAREYVLQFTASLRGTSGKVRELAQEHARWEQRVKLAVEGGREDLAATARERLADIQRRIGVLGEEERDLEAQLSTLRDQLRRLQHRVDSTIDADQLLAELDAIVGERDQLAERFEEMRQTEDSEQALEALKDRMRDPPPAEGS